MDITPAAAAGPTDRPPDSPADNAASTAEATSAAAPAGADPEPRGLDEIAAELAAVELALQRIEQGDFSTTGLFPDPSPNHAAITADTTSGIETGHVTGDALNAAAETSQSADAETSQSEAIGTSQSVDADQPMPSQRLMGDPIELSRAVTEIRADDTALPPGLRPSPRADAAEYVAAQAVDDIPFEAGSAEADGGSGGGAEPTP